MNIINLKIKSLFKKENLILIGFIYIKNKEKEFKITIK